MSNQHRYYIPRAETVKPHPQENYKASGPTLSEADSPRIGTVARKVWDIMTGQTYPAEHSRNLGWWELNKVAEYVGAPHSSITACVRGFRNLKNGGHKVESIRKETNHGTYLYRLTPNTPAGIETAKAAAKAVPPQELVIDELKSAAFSLIAKAQPHGADQSVLNNPAIRRLAEALRATGFKPQQ